MRTFAACLAAAVAAAVYPSFPLDWSAFVSEDLVQNQGNYELPNGDLCCAAEANDCQVQVQSQAGMQYFSFTTNQTANVYGTDYDPYAIVDDFNLGMEMAVDNTYTCTSYCPIQGPMDPFDVSGYTDMGPSSIDGIAAELWQAIDLFPVLNITMEVDNLYINQTNPANAFPIKDVDTLTPFGEYLGQSNTTYASWKPGKQPAQWFAVKGVSSCQQDSNCDQSTVRQLHRLSTGRKADFVAAHFRAKAAKAAEEQKVALAAIAALQKRK